MKNRTHSWKSGQATVEFALASLVFLLFVFGTIDFGRAIFVSAELHNAAREGTRYGIVHPTDTAGMKSAVVAKAVGTGLTTAGVTVSCSGGCTTGGTVTVSAQVSFSAVTQSFLGIPALTLNASSTAEIE
jgi:Flp pilus assembly protein TadG